jgi:hypothetical protein
MYCSWDGQTIGLLTCKKDLNYFLTESNDSSLLTVYYIMTDFRIHYLAKSQSLKLTFLEMKIKNIQVTA